MAPTRCSLNRDQRDTLESFIDATNVEAVIEAIGRICIEKALHIDSNWGDGLLRDAWLRAARALSKVEGSKAITDLSTD